MITKTNLTILKVYLKVFDASADKKSSDKYQDIYQLINQRLQNLTQVNQGNDQNNRRTFVPTKSVGKTVAENLMPRNNTTVPLRNSSSQQINQTKDQNNRRSYVPLATGYGVNPLAGNTMAGNLPAGNSLARNQLGTNPPAGNLVSTKQAVVNPVAGKPVLNPMAGNSLAGNRLGTNQPAGNWGNSMVAKQAVVNPVAGIPALNAMAGNSLAGNRPGTIQPAGNSLATQQAIVNPVAGNPVMKPVVGNSLAGNQPVWNQMAGNLSTGKHTAGNPSSRNSVVGNKPVGSLPVGKTQVGNSQVSNYLTSAGQPGAPMFSSSLNAGATINEDRSGIYTSLYRQPSTYDRKNTINRQSSLGYSQLATPPNGLGNIGGNGRYSTPLSGVKKSGVYTPIRNTPGYQNYQQMGNRPPNYSYQQTRYSGYTGYPGFQNQQGMRGYSASLGYQVGYPGILQQRQQSHYPATKQIRDRIQVANNVKNSNKSDQNFTTMISANSNTIQIKLPDKPATANSPPSIQSASPDNIPAESSGSGLGSGSGSGFDEPVDMENTTNFEESPELSSSGSGDTEYLNMNTGLNGDVSDVAFMLAGTNHDTPPYPAPGLPMNLTRQQALDIYKSAMYFAGLMRPGEW